MRATLGIQWLIVLLGFLCRSVCSDAISVIPSTTNDTKVGSEDGKTATNTTATNVSAAATTEATVTTVQNNITQSTTVQTPTATQTIPTTTENTPIGTAQVKETTASTARMTFSTNTAGNTSTVIISSTLTSSTDTATTATTPSTGPVVNPQPTTVTTSAYSLSTKTTAPYNVSSQTVSEKQHEGTNSPTAQTSKAPALTHLTTEQLISREGSIEMSESATVPGGTTATTHLRDPGVSSTSSSTSFSVNKGVNTTSTDSAVQATTVTTRIKTPTSTQKFVYSHKGKVQTKEKDDEKNLRKVCKRLMEGMENGTCTLNWLIQNGSVKIETVEINGHVNESLAQQYYDELTQKEQIKTDNRTLIAILASCGALLIMIVILGACASHHRKPYNENQQHLTEELHTVENGYHDNPTLEVMEVQPEMLEKKMVLNGEFNDSWMVPLDHLSKEEHPEEEDTHL